MRWLGLVLVAACTDFEADLRTCAALGRCRVPCERSSDCGEGLSCREGTCEAPTTVCVATTLPGPTRCGSDRDLFIAPTGLDSNPGTREAPRRTFDGLALLPGDRLHALPGVYVGALLLSGQGRSDCPITFDGTADGGTRFETTTRTNLVVSGSFWRLSGFTVRAREFGNLPSGLGTSANAGQREVLVLDVDFEWEGRVQQVAAFDFCEDCGVVASRFTAKDSGDASNLVFVSYAPRFLFRGNTARGLVIRDAVLSETNSPAMVVEGNVFEGMSAARFGAGGAFRRNVVRDDPQADATTVLVAGADRVESNTFVNLGRATVADRGVFSNNLVSLAGVGSAGPIGSYNLFNAVRPYADAGVSATDVVALPRLDPELVPLADSPALDAADPQLPVPAGGGARADIGALERGASRGVDGRYCVTDAGP